MEIKNNQMQFKKPVTVKVPMRDIVREGVNDGDTEMMAFKIHENGDIQIIHDAHVTCANMIATFQVWSFSQ